MMESNLSRNAVAGLRSAYLSAALWLVWLSACQSEPAVYVTLRGYPPKTQSVHISVRAGGTVISDRYHCTLDDQYELKLLDGKNGPVDIEITALDDGYCWLATAALHEDSVSSALRNFVERTVVLTALPAPECVLHMSYEPELGSIASAPAGIPCRGWAEPDCFAHFPRGTTPTLTATSFSADRIASWRSSCGDRRQCQVDLDRSTRADVSFACTREGWCASYPPVTRQTLRSIWGTSGQDVWAVGDSGVIVHYDGQSWSLSNSPSTEVLHSISGEGPGKIWVVGDRGTILQFEAGEWNEAKHGLTTQNLRGVWVNRERSVWAVGAQGGRLRHNIGTMRSDWTLFDADYDRMTHNLPDNADYVFDQPLTAIWGFTDDADERGWLVGENGVIGDYSRVFNWGFSKNKTGVMTPMNGIWSPSQNPRTGVAWVVGGQGTIFHHSPTDAWRSDTFTDNDLTSIYGTSADDIWTVGANGTIGHHDTNIAKPWTRLPAGTSAKLYGVWGSAKNDVWAVGEKGTILHYQPERVRQAPTEPPRQVCDQKNL